MDFLCSINAHDWAILMTLRTSVTHLIRGDTIRPEASIRTEFWVGLSNPILAAIRTQQRLK